MKSLGLFHEEQGTFLEIHCKTVCSKAFEQFTYRIEAKLLMARSVKTFCFSLGPSGPSLDLKALNKF